MSVLAQTFLTFVRSHFVPFVFFSVWHFKVLLDCYVRLFDFADKDLSRLEGRNVVCRDDDGRVLGDVTCSLLCAFLDNETTKTAKIDVLTLCEGSLYAIHETFNDFLGNNFFYALCFCYFVYDVCFSHNSSNKSS